MNGPQKKQMCSLIDTKLENDNCWCHSIGVSNRFTLEMSWFASQVRDIAGPDACNELVRHFYAKSSSSSIEQLLEKYLPGYIDYYYDNKVVSSLQNQTLRQLPYLDLRWRYSMAFEQGEPLPDLDEYGHRRFKLSHTNTSMCIVVQRDHYNREASSIITRTTHNERLPIPTERLAGVVRGGNNEDEDEDEPLRVRYDHPWMSEWWCELTLMSPSSSSDWMLTGRNVPRDANERDPQFSTATESVFHSQMVPWYCVRFQDLRGDHDNRQHHHKCCSHCIHHS